MVGGSAIRGSRVGAGPMGEAERGDAAPRLYVSYFCSNGHETRPAFAADAAVPDTWDCPRCGLPANLDYAEVRGLSKEVQQKLNQHKPETIGQAGRIQGVTPAAISLLLVWLKRRDLAARAGAAAPEAAALANAADDVARRPAA